jgi:hypothetical protein
MRCLALEVCALPSKGQMPTNCSRTSNATILAWWTKERYQYQHEQSEFSTNWRSVTYVSHFSLHNGRLPSRGVTFPWPEHIFRVVQFGTYLRIVWISSFTALALFSDVSSASISEKYAMSFLSDHESFLSSMQKLSTIKLSSFSSMLLSERTTPSSYDAHLDLHCLSWYAFQFNTAA